MEPIDKAGRPIFPHIFRELQAKGRILEKLGYQEARNKSNLFVCKYNLVVFFADMRGTGIIPIWRDPSPMVYWSFKQIGLDVAVRQRAVFIEWSRIQAAGPRLSNELDYNQMLEAQIVSDDEYARSMVGDEIGGEEA